MPNQNDTIKSCVVKIEHNGAFLQSGVLWVPSEESEVAYVFTVKHGIENSEPSNIQFWCGDVGVNHPVIDVQFHPNKEIDAAILTIPNHELPVSPYACLTLNDLKALINKESATVQLQVLGYPVIRCSGGYPGPNQQHYFPCSIDNTYENQSSRTFMAFYDRNARISETDPENDLKGFSGGGLFARIQNVVFLCGIYRGTPTEAVPNRDITVLSLQAIQEICSDYNHPPNFQPLIPDSLKKHLGSCLCDLGSDHILKDCLQEVSRCNFTELIRTSCGQCNPCEYGEHFYLCDRFQQQLLNSSALLNYHNAGFDEHEALKVLKGQKYHEVRVICSDVRYPTHVSELIQALKQDYLGRNKLSENTLILWAGKERCKQYSSSCTRTEYQNIISDIAKAPKNPLDFSDVNEAPEQLAVINVPYILDEMGANPKAFSDFVNRM